jgi:hypothetical protein
MINVSEYLPVSLPRTRTHVNGPDARACANIQCISWLLDWREVQFAVEGQAQDVMLKIQSIRFALSTRQRTAVLQVVANVRPTSSLGKIYLPSLYAVSNISFLRRGLSQTIRFE